MVLAVLAGGCEGSLTVRAEQDGGRTPGPRDQGEQRADDGSLPPTGGAVGIAVTGVEVNQGVGVRVVEEGEPTPVDVRAAPLLHGRPTLVRATWQLADDFAPRTVEARLTVESGGRTATFVDRRMVEGESSFDGEAFFRWVLEADDLDADSAVVITLHEAEPDSSVDVTPPRLPAEGALDLALWPDRMALKVVLVPIETGCAPYGREWNAEVEAAYRAYMMSVFPVQTMELVYDEPLTDFASTCDPDVIAADLMAALADRREADGRGPDWYYQGLLTDENSPFEIAGYAWIVDAERDADRTSWAEWLDDNPGPISAHEIGHNHGRRHDDARERTTYGWGPFAGEYPTPRGEPLRALKRPAGEGSGRAYYDYMSYSYPYWTSAFNYRAAAERIRTLSRWEMQGRADSALEGGRTLVGYLGAAGAAWVVVRGGTDAALGGVTMRLPDGRRLDGAVQRGGHDEVGAVRIAVPIGMRADELAGARVEVGERMLSVPSADRIRGADRL